MKKGEKLYFQHVMNIQYSKEKLLVAFFAELQALSIVKALIIQVTKMWMKKPLYLEKSFTKFIYS